MKLLHYKKILAQGFAYASRFAYPLGDLIINTPNQHCLATSKQCSTQELQTYLEAWVSKDGPTLPHQLHWQSTTLSVTFADSIQDRQISRVFKAPLWSGRLEKSRGDTELHSVQRDKLTISLKPDSPS